MTLGLRPSLHNLRQSFCSFVRLLRRYYGALRLLPGVHVRLVAIRLPGPVCLRRRQGGLPVLVHIVSRRTRGLRLRGAPLSLAMSAEWIWPSLSVHRVGAPGWFFAARYPAHRCLYPRFGHRLATVAAGPEVRMVRYSFPVRIFHPRQCAGLSRRSDSDQLPSFQGSPERRLRMG